MLDPEKWLDEWEANHFPALYNIFLNEHNKAKLVQSLIEDEKASTIEGIKRKLGSKKTLLLLDEYNKRMETGKDTLMPSEIERYLSLLPLIEIHRRENYRLWCELVAKCLINRMQSVSPESFNKYKKPKMLKRYVDLCKGESAGNITISIEPSMEHSLPHIRIKSKNMDQSYHLHSIGFCHKKKPDESNQKFATLLKFALYNGIISPTEYDKTTEKSVSRLRKHLSSLLGIKSPIDNYKKRIGYRSNIKIEDKSYFQESYNTILKDARKTDALDLVNYDIDVDTLTRKREF